MKRILSILKEKSRDKKSWTSSRFRLLFLINLYKIIKQFQKEK